MEIDENLIRLMESGDANFKIAVTIMSEDECLKWLEYQRDLILDGKIKPKIHEYKITDPDSFRLNYWSEAETWKFGDRLIRRVLPNGYMSYTNYFWFIDDKEQMYRSVKSLPTLLNKVILDIISDYF